MNQPPVNNTPNLSPALLLMANDDVLIACRDIEKGTHIGESHGLSPVVTAEKIPSGHKLARSGIKKGDPIRKFGQVIGFASNDIAPGSHVHSHNLEAGSFARAYEFGIDARPLAPASTKRFFEGYDRGDGRYGTRNYIAIICSVNCSASASKYIVRELEKRGVLALYPDIDGVVAITHKAGCAMQYGGADHLQLNRTLAGIANHPNVAAYLLVGLGCETGQISHLIENQNLIQLGMPGRQKPNVLQIQEQGGISKTVEAGVEAVERLLKQASGLKRTRLGADKLILATNCGGSDGYSGVTANPALGVASDLLVAQGGTSVLAETTEIYGAEHLLTRRAINREVGEKLLERIRWWEWYTGIFGAQINNNPSPGNKAGGLTTIYEKSLGAVAKAGTSPMVDVVLYAEPIKAKGFVVMDTPGYDPVSMTGLAAGGANIGVFTTGRGSVFGCKPMPCIKVATNTPMYTRMVDDMDIDAGTILSGESVSQVGARIFEEILAVASGKKTKSEMAGVGDEEFAPWSIGPTL
jgi:altronate hydrolase